MEKYLGYVVSEGNEIKNLPFFIKWRPYNDIASIMKEQSYVLIVGYKTAKRFFGERFSIIDKNIGGGKVFWTFMKTEKRIDYDKDLTDFFGSVLRHSANEITYYFINFFKIKYNAVKNLLKLLKSKKLKYIYYYNRMAYIHCDKSIFGISEEQLEFIGIGEEKLLRVLNEAKNKVIINPSYKPPYSVRSIINEEYMTPFFYRLKNNLKEQ